MSTQQSNNALSVTEASLRKALSQLKHHQTDGWIVVDQAHAIAKQVSLALNQHSKNALVIPPLLLSAATEVHGTMNKGLAPEWERVRDNDTRMEKHLFFPKTKGYAKFSFSQCTLLANIVIAAPALAPVPTPVSVLPPAPKMMSVPLINSLPAEAAKLKTDKGKGKQPDQGTHDKSRKKRKLVKSKPVITVSDGEDDQPSRTIIVAKPSKVAVPQTPAPTKKAKQGKGKEKQQQQQEDMVVEIPASNVFDPPCKKCDQGPCLIAVGRRGQPMKSCIWCNAMKVKCEHPEELPAPTKPVRPLRPQSQAALVLKSTPRSRSTRATSRAHQPMPIVESEDAGDDTDVVVIAKDDIVMSDAADTDQQTDVAAPSHTGDQPATIMSVNDFPPKHWLEESDTITIPPPSPTAKPTTLAVELTIHKCVVALVARVTAMEMADRTTQARINAVEQDCDSHISTIRAEFADVQLSFNHTVELVTGEGEEWCSKGSKRAQETKGDVMVYASGSAEVSKKN
ncbi:hypothetical protein BDR03DRAFT_985994 [Suillus americanus]|nr:hypothetical protein BDR03DRAFT_985994 [Suillus americanus]